MASIQYTIADHVNQLHSAPDGYYESVAIDFPRRRHTRNHKRTPAERWEICSLVAEGWWPMDVAVAYGFPIYRHQTRSRAKYCSTIYGFLANWLPRYYAALVAMGEQAGLRVLRTVSYAA